MKQTSHRSAQFLDAVADALPRATEPPLTAREIHARVGCWAPVSVRVSLPDLERQGRAVSITAPYNGGIRRLWRAPGPSTKNPTF